jgi:WD40 repeat protein
MTYNKLFVAKWEIAVAEKDRGAYVEHMPPRTPTVESQSVFGFYRFRACLRHLQDAAERRLAFLLFFLGAGLVLVHPCAGQTWTATGSLATARQEHSATLLPNGQVLVAGGFDGSGTVLASAELYDPASGTWTATGSLATARHRHAATLLPNGQVLVAGGVDNFNSLANAELYDPASGTWTATGSLNTARLSHTATLLPDGKVLVVGGDRSAQVFSALASAELYDPASGTWTATGSLITARASHAATLLPNGQVLVAGGVGQPPELLASAELYDPASGTWTATGSLATAREEHSATLLPNGKVLVAGGIGTINFPAIAELYDPASGTWTATGSLITARYAHTATLLPNGNVLVAAGNGGSGSLASAELYHSAPQAINLSTRMFVQTGDNVGIGGFIITGSTPKHVVLRAIGPSLTNFGLTDVLADPVLELHGPGAFVTITNNNWRDDRAQAALIQADGLAPTNDLESAIDVILAPGAYTAIVRGNTVPPPPRPPTPNPNGVALVEVYDLSPLAASKLADISTRAFVSTGDNIVIAGFILGNGGGVDRIVARGLGPSLTAFGVSNTLADPTLELRDSNGTLLIANNNWQDNAVQAAELMADGLAPTNPLESGIAATLPPGLYTALLAGLNNGTGIGLVEVYDLGAP